MYGRHDDTKVHPPVDLGVLESHSVRDLRNTVIAHTHKQDRRISVPADLDLKMWAKWCIARIDDGFEQV